MTSSFRKSTNTMYEWHSKNITYVNWKQHNSQISGLIIHTRSGAEKIAKFFYQLLNNETDRTFLHSPLQWYSRLFQYIYKKHLRFVTWFYNNSEGPLIRLDIFIIWSRMSSICDVGLCRSCVHGVIKYFVESLFFVILRCNFLYICRCSIKRQRNL